MMWPVQNGDVPVPPIGTSLNKIPYWYRVDVLLRKPRVCHKAPQRIAHPHALFVVYAGDNHLTYNQPFSLGKQLAMREPSFMVSLVPGISFKNLDPNRAKQLKKYPWFKAKEEAITRPGVFAPISRFDFITEFEFPDRVLQFKPIDRELAGFDIQIKIPENK